MKDQHFLPRGPQTAKSDRCTHLIEQVAAPENLLSAWRSVRGNIPRYRRERSSGPDGISLEDFERELPSQLDALRDMLMHDRYQPQPPLLVKLPKSNGKHRQIAILNVTDRVAQRAAQQVLEPIWEPGFLPCSYGFRPGRSIQQAVDQARQERTHGNDWVVDGDISACFDSLDHTLLIKRVEARIDDLRMIALIRMWLEQGILQHGMPSQPVGRMREGLDKFTGGIKKGAGLVLNLLIQPSLTKISKVGMLTDGIGMMGAPSAEWGAILRKIILRIFTLEMFILGMFIPRISILKAWVRRTCRLASPKAAVLDCSSLWRAV